MADLLLDEGVGTWGELSDAGRPGGQPCPNPPSGPPNRLTPQLSSPVRCLLQVPGLLEELPWLPFRICSLEGCCLRQHGGGGSCALACAASSQGLGLGPSRAT